MAALCSLLSAGLTEGRAQTNSFVVEPQIGAAPVDLEITPNGLIAVVRGNLLGSIAESDQKVSLWDTTEPVALLAQIVPTPANQVGRGNLPVSSTGLPRFSDAVAATNDRVIAIGSAAVDSTQENRTYVDVLSISYAFDPPTATVLNRHVLGTGTSSTTIAGLAHDVAITPDGALAVVSHRNWIHVVRMSDGALAAAHNVGSGIDGPCYPGDSRNSVAVTDSRAIVTATRPGAFSPGETWVYIVNLSQASDPQIVLEHGLGPVPGWNNADTSPHDLAITPNGQRAVVTSNGHVALFDLVTNSLVGTPYSLSSDERDWNGAQVALWDSVEVSNIRAVTLSNRAFGTGGYAVWHLDVFDISGGSLTKKLDYSAPYSNSTDDRGWDLALSDDGQFATVKTGQQDVALLDVVDPTSADVCRAGIGSSNPPLSSYVGPFVGNDATLILQPSGSPQRLWAAFVGMAGDGQGGGTVKLRYYDLLAPGWTVGSSVLDIASFTSIGTFPPAYVIPADLDRSIDGLEVFLRNSAPVEDSGQTGKPDWSRYGSSPAGQIGSSWGGKGWCGTYLGGVLAADVMRVGRGKVVSISQHGSQPLGWVHIVSVQ